MYPDDSPAGVSAPALTINQPSPDFPIREIAQNSFSPRLEISIL
jgi:hypothetical protein